MRILQQTGFIRAGGRGLVLQTAEKTPVQLAQGGPAALAFQLFGGGLGHHGRHLVGQRAPGFQHQLLRGAARLVFDVAAGLPVSLPLLAARFREARVKIAADLLRLYLAALRAALKALAQLGGADFRVLGALQFLHDLLAAAGDHVGDHLAPDKIERGRKDRKVDDAV